MAFPSSIKIGNGKEPMKVAVENLFIDKSGFTLDCGVVNAINYKAGESGTIGGFKFSLDKVMVSIVQNDFKKFGFNGKLEIPCSRERLTTPAIFTISPSPERVAAKVLHTYSRLRRLRISTLTSCLATSLLTRT